MTKECPECGGKAHPMVSITFRDFVCRDCGYILGEERFIEEEMPEDDGDYEVME